MNKRVILIDGPDNCGKSELAGNLKKYLEEKGHTVAVWGNPSKDPARPISFGVRTLLAANQGKITDLATMGLVIASFADTYVGIQRSDAEIHLVDRSEYSTHAYQSLIMDEDSAVEPQSKNFMMAFTDLVRTLFPEQRTRAIIFCMHRWEVKVEEGVFDPTLIHGHGKIFDNFQWMINNWFIHFNTTGDPTPYVLKTPEDYDLDMIYTNVIEEPLHEGRGW